MRALRIVLWLHMLPCALLPFATSQRLLALPALFAIGASWLYMRRHPALGIGPRAIVHLIAVADDVWRLEFADAHRVAATLQPDSAHIGQWLVLRFRTEDGKSCARLIVGDEAEPESLRRLRLRVLSATPAA